MAGWTRIFTISILWATSFAINEMLLISHGPLTIVFYRALFATVFLAFFFYLIKAEFKLSYKKLLSNGILATFNYVLPSLLLIWSQDKIGVSITSLSSALTPLLTLCFILLLLKGEHATFLRITSVIVGGAGFIITMLSFDTVNFSTATLPFIAIVISSVSYAIGAVVGEKIADINPLSSALGQMFMSTILMIPIFYLEPNFVKIEFSVTVFLLFATLGFACTGVAYILFYKSLQVMGSLPTSFIAILVPSFVIVGSFIFSSEDINRFTIIGLLIIFISLFLVDRER